jgi:hypothetical protein
MKAGEFEKKCCKNWEDCRIYKRFQEKGKKLPG